jgi:hypothetical protein
MSIDARHWLRPFCWSGGKRQAYPLSPQWLG